MEITCSSCDTKRESPQTKTGKPRIPRGWKEIHGDVYCPKCKLTHYGLRAVSIPVAKCDWKQVMPVLRAGWNDAIRCANWLLCELYRLDSIAGDSSEKLPKWQAPYLYPAARLKFPDIVPTTLVSLINTVQSKYRAARFDLWRGAASLPTYRSFPLPINSQTWKLEKLDNEWIFRFRLAGEWREVTLRGGRQFYRQHAGLEQIVSGETEAGEAAIYEQGKTLMLKIPGWFPRVAVNKADHTVNARTLPDGFLIAVDGKAQWKLNADHVKQWIIGGQKQQQRLQEDLKAERRFPHAMRKGIVDRMGHIAEKRRNRMNSWVHEASMQLVNWTKRRHASTLVWNDKETSMLPSFPWYIFSQRLEEKCQMAGIQFVHATGEEEKPKE